MTAEDKKLAKEILFNPPDYRTWYDRFNIQCISCRDALRAMEAYHQAKLKEIVVIEKQSEEQSITDYKIDKEWIFEILNKTNEFAKQLIVDHFKRHNQ